MTIQRRKLLALAGLAGLGGSAALLPSLAAAQAGSYPNKPVKFIVPYAAGGLPDSVARVVSQRLGDRLGQPVIVDNRPGAGGVAAWQALQQSQPTDGHSFIVSDASMVSITPLVIKNVPYQADKDILMVSQIARSPLFIVAHPKTGVKTLQEFIALVKSRPGEFTYGSSGIGSTHQLTMEALKAALNLDIRHVPFRGSGQSTPALVAGQVDFSVAALPSVAGFVRDGRVRLIASNAAQRSPQAPDVPAIAEIVPGFDFAPMVGVFAAVGTPQYAIDRIAREMAVVVKAPDVVKSFESNVVEPVGAGPAEFTRAVRREMQAMAQAAKAANLKAE